MDEHRINTLSDKIVKGTISELEMKEFNEWYTTYDSLIQNVDSDKNSNALSRRMFTNIAANAELGAFTSKQVKLWPRFAAAASFVLVLAVGLYFYTSESKREYTSIVPGKNTATLTLAGGKEIILSEAVNGELAKESGVVISKTSDGKIVYEVRGADVGTNKFNTLSTANGETYQIRLPDGTSVWLNAASSLKYVASFKGLKNRYVELKGEAYFEVAKDKLHPFIVKTASQEIRVLGTHFNVNSYSDEEAVKTTLLEGAVNVKTAADQKVLKPGEQAIVRANKVKVVKADTESAAAWKNGEFVFRGESIQEIMRNLARWYNVKVEYRGPVTDEEFQGKILRQKSITEVLELLELTEAVHFKIEGRKIIVTK